MDESVITGSIICGLAGVSITPSVNRPTYQNTNIPVCPVIPIELKLNEEEENMDGRQHTTDATDLHDHICVGFKLLE